MGSSPISASAGGLERLLAAQAPDGGWPYRNGAAATEPTACALLALRRIPEHGEAYRRGVAWLRRTQRPDGGWAPQPFVDRSTWVTAPALLVCPDSAEAVRWLLASASRNSRPLQRLRARLLGQPPEPVAGWPFYPETTAWVTPTAWSILALAAVNRRRPDASVTERIAAAREFLLSRRCADGGWNHGANQALGYPAGSYPETTGLALLALRGADPRRLRPSFEAARRHAAACRSAEGIAWLRLGLRAHGVAVDFAPADPVCRTVMDCALLALSSQDEVFAG